MNYKEFFFPQQKLSFNLIFKDVFTYKSGVFCFYSNSGNLINNIFFKENAIFDDEDNLIASLDPYGSNAISGDFESGIFSSFFNKILIKQANTSPEYFIISGIEFSGFEKIELSGLYDISIPNFNYTLFNNSIYSININPIIFDNENLTVNFNYSSENVGPLVISGFNYTDISKQYYYLDPDVEFPIVINPGSSFSFNLINRYELEQKIPVYLTFLTNDGEIEYDQQIEAQKVSGFSFGNTTIDVNPVSVDERFAHWTIEIDNILGRAEGDSITGDVYVELSGFSGDNVWYKMNNSSQVFGIAPGAYQKSFFNNYWSGHVYTDDKYLAPIDNYYNLTSEDFGNIESLKEFAWTDKWEDAQVLNESNSLGIILKIDKDGFNLDDLNLYLYSKNNTSGTLNYFIYDLFVTGKSDGYKNILSGMGWTTGTLSNCCGNSGFPPGFPSGFPFTGQNIYGFFSGFGFGNLSGYLLTGEPKYSGSVLVDSDKLTPKDPEYFAPISDNQIISLNLGHQNINSGFYAFIFNAVPDNNIENETGIFWPKMWPTDVINSEDFIFVLEQNLDSRYFYYPGMHNSGYYYSGSDTGIHFIKNIKSQNTGFSYSGIDYNVAFSVNKKDSFEELLQLSYNNTKNYIIMNIFRYLNPVEILYQNFQDKCAYKISGQNFLKTGIFEVKYNENNQLEAFVL